MLAALVLPAVAIVAPAPVPHVGCSGDGSTIGAPFAAATDSYAQIALSSDGCAIARMVTSTRGTDATITWDGGATSASYTISWSAQVALESDRAVVWSEHTIGFVRPGDSAPAWRAPFQVLTSNVIAVVTDGPSTLVQSDTWLRITDDDGVTWRDLPALPATARIATAATATWDEYGDQGMGDFSHEHHAYELRDAAWKEVRAPRVSGWTYALESQEHWGCGGTSRLVADRGKQHHELFGGLDDQVDNYSLATSTRGSYAQARGALWRLDRGAARQIDAGNTASAIFLVGVDAFGAPLMTTGGSLIRWTPKGGYRVVL
jgi:hypothetical protein